MHKGYAQGTGVHPLASRGWVRVSWVGTGAGWDGVVAGSDHRKELLSLEVAGAGQRRTLVTRFCLPTELLHYCREIVTKAAPKASSGSRLAFHIAPVEVPGVGAKKARLTPATPTPSATPTELSCIH